MSFPLAGVWSREWEEDPLGDADSADRTTLVLWTQSAESRIYVDLRLPAADDDCFRKKSFAGVLEYSPGDTTDGTAQKADADLAKLAPLSTCFWRRDVDYQPPSGSLDVGVCGFEDGGVRLRETGQDGSYAEGWVRLPGTEKGPFLAMKLLDETRKGYCVRAGDRFAYAVGRSTECESNSHKISEAVGKSLEEALKSISSSKEEQLNMAYSYVAVAGEIDDKNQWTIRHAINPELVGCILFGIGENDRLVYSHLSGSSEVGKTVQQRIPSEGTGEARSIVRVWEVVELDGCSIPFGSPTS